MHYDPDDSDFEHRANGFVITEPLVELACALLHQVVLDNHQRGILVRKLRLYFDRCNAGAIGIANLIRENKLDLQVRERELRVALMASQAAARLAGLIAPLNI
jgi:hypothetical protein